ncbi:MAG: hypothetical protein A3C02_00405 [Candidatus Andersenbacteria bacterium RIFCSPHIGHO2_02_FULL_45_11]|uniref:Inositol-1-monophosphatase n=1 Tax=Candidatus Andersenbacteria bacterium RIFCSPHIGHO2_12_FULL_45_11 TaxID=1797281 RepID=A0A1G1WZV9_9BACT|nr:MAG: hypothetical protein A3D99_03170 [Candidatus Andersenbacteria bacterium RIFCSPHIGHO2_12_FULL_45_11]OGY34649.1 MAG: hypothetical protein A3C02_00405 [Candidatus Andersenbacteria bacterium RIFCSPHIGHO2_02_FULL_45_11]
MIDAAIQAAKNAGEVIRTNFVNSVLPTVTYKDANNIVTETDTSAELAIFSVLKKEFPDHSFFSEEAGLTQTQSEYLWVIDPLDGTSNFAQGLPFFCVSVALFKNNQPILGVIYDPIHDELFAAQAGKGAQLNGTPITSSNANTLEKSVLALGRGSSVESKLRHTSIYTAITPKVRSARVMGSAALAITYSACGRLDGIIINDCKFYDCAAANIIARESGALVSDFAGNPLTHETEGMNDILIASPNIQQELIQILSTY